MTKVGVGLKNGGAQTLNEMNAKSLESITTSQNVWGKGKQRAKNKRRGRKLEKEFRGQRKLPGQGKMPPGI